MEIKKAKEIMQKLVAWYDLGNKSTTINPDDFEAVVITFKELDRLQKENEELIKETRKKIIIAPGRRGLTKTYEYGLIVGKKRECDYWKNKIREKIKKHRRDLYSNIERYVADELEDLLKEE